MVECNSRKAAIIGCGFVGATSAFALAESGLFSEIVLLDKDRDRAEGEALDLSHGLPFAKPVQIYAGHYEDVSDAAVLILTAGAGQKPRFRKAVAACPRAPRGIHEARAKTAGRTGKIFGRFQLRPRFKRGFERRRHRRYFSGSLGR